MDAQTTILTLRCTVCGAQANPKCACGAPYAYVSPGELALKAVLAHPEKSDRAIAKEVGVSDRTVNRARQATATNDAVEKRAGRDGKKRKMPKAAPKTDKVQHAVDSLVQAGQPVSRKKLAAEFGVGGKTIQLAHQRAIGRNSAEPTITLDMLSLTAQQKLDAAIRQQQRRLDAEYHDRLRQGIQEYLKRHMPNLQEQHRKSIEAEHNYRKFIARQKKIFTTAEYLLILAVLHPDDSASIERRKTAYLLFENEDRRFAMTGEKK